MSNIVRKIIITVIINNVGKKKRLFNIVLLFIQIFMAFDTWRLQNALQRKVNLSMLSLSVRLNKRDTN